MLGYFGKVSFTFPKFVLDDIKKDRRCWMLDVGCWMLEIGNWKFGVVVKVSGFRFSSVLHFTFF